MRADRLLAILMLLQHRGRLTAAEIAAEVEVSLRTVLRDVEALSASGVPVYTDRGRGGGIRLIPGYRTDLTGLTLDEAKALLSSGSGRVASPAFASAMRKVAAALPGPHRVEATRAAQRILVAPTDSPGPARPSRTSSSSSGRSSTGYACVRCTAAPMPTPPSGSLTLSGSSTRATTGTCWPCTRAPSGPTASHASRD